MADSAPWNVATAMWIGAFAGVIVAPLRSAAEANLLTISSASLAGLCVGGALGGAVLGGLVAFVRNRLFRQ